MVSPAYSVSSADLIEPALSLPGTGRVQTLESGVAKLILHCSVSETVLQYVHFTTGGACELGFRATGSRFAAASA